MQQKRQKHLFTLNPHRVCHNYSERVKFNNLLGFSASFAVAVFGQDNPNKRLCDEAEPWRPRLLWRDIVSSIVLPGGLN